MNHIVYFQALSSDVLAGSLGKKGGDSACFSVIFNSVKDEDDSIRDVEEMTHGKDWRN